MLKKSIKFIGQIIYNPIRARISYDFIIAFGVVWTTWILLVVFKLPRLNFYQAAVYPFLFIFLNYLIGIYGRFKTASIKVKFFLLLISTLMIFVVYFLLHSELFNLYLISLAVIPFSILPRIFFNVYTSKSNKNYFNIIDFSLGVERDRI